VAMPTCLVDAVGPVELAGPGVVEVEHEVTNGGWLERYLRIDGRRAYALGNGCGTCEFLFRRLQGANQTVSPAEMRLALSSGLTGIGEAAAELGRLVPAGRYTQLLLEVHPRLVRPSGRATTSAASRSSCGPSTGSGGCPTSPACPTTGPVTGPWTAPAPCSSSSCPWSRRTG